MRKDKKPIRRKLTLVNLATGEMTTIDAVESFAFSADGKQLLMRHYAPERAPAPARGEPDPAAALDPEDAPGVTAIVRDLATGRDTTFGNVSDAAWQSKGRLLALAIAAEDRAGNGVQVFDPSAGTLRVLDSASSRYLGLTWRKDADDLAVLRSKSDDTRDGATYAVLAWTGVGGASEKKRAVRSRPAIPALGVGAGVSSRSAGRRGPRTAGRSSSASRRGPRRRRRRQGQGQGQGRGRSGRAVHRRRVASARRRRDAEAEDRRHARSPAQPARGVADRQSRRHRARPRFLRAGRAAEAAATSPTPSAGPPARSIGAGAGSAPRRSRWSTSRLESAPRSSTAPTTASSAPAPRASTSSITLDGQYWTIDTARRTVDQHHQVGRDLVRRSRVRFDRRAAAVVRRRRRGRRATRRSCSTTSSTSGRSRRTAPRPSA